MDFDGPLELKEYTLNNLFYARALQELNLEPIKPVSHKYCFVTGRHGEFLYLKMGAACKRLLNETKKTCQNQTTTFSNFIFV